MVLKVLKFISTSIINTIAGFGIILLLQELFLVNPYLSNIIGYSAGYIISYLLNKNWTFKFSGSHLKSAKRFIVVSAYAYLLNLLALHIMLGLGVNQILAQIFAIITHGMVHFFAMQFFVFKQDKI